VTPVKHLHNHLLPVGVLLNACSDSTLPNADGTAVKSYHEKGVPTVKFHALRATLIVPITLAACLTALAGGGGPALAAKGKTPASAAPPAMPSPSGRVSYRMKVMSLTGTLDVVWSEGGKKSRSDMRMSGTLPGAPSGTTASTTMDAWGISDGAYIYSHQPMWGKTVYRMKMPKDSRGAAGTPGSVPAKELKSAKLVGKATILGKPCEIREVQGSKVWMWKGLVLKTESTGGMAPNLTATKLEMPYRAASSLFKVPAGYKVTDQMPGMGGGPGGPAAGGFGGGGPIRKGSQ